MARLTGPAEASREVKALVGGYFRGKDDRPAQLWADPEGTVPADVLWPDGSPIPMLWPDGSSTPMPDPSRGVAPTVTIDGNSFLPDFLFPPGVDVVYVTCDGGPPWPIYAQVDNRLDALEILVAEAAATAGAAETPAGAQSKADTAQAASAQRAANLSDLSNVATARTNLGLGNGATRNVGTTVGTVVAGDDSRIVGAVQRGTLVVNVKDYGAKGDGSTNDTAAINAALVALTPGTTLLFPPGRYMTDGNHVVNQPSVTIKGSSGRAQTYNSQAQLYLRNGANVDMLIIAANQVTVRDLSLYGNKTNQTVTSRGLVTPPTSGANYLLLDAVWVDSFNGDGFSFESSGGTLSSTISNCESRVNNGYGMRFYGTSTDSMVIGCYIDQNVQSGIFCSAGDLSLTSCHIWGNGTGNTGDLDGITFQSSAGCRVINCYIETQINGAGIRFKTGANKGHIVSGCDIWSNGLQGIYAFSASNCVFSGNVIRTNNYKNGAGSSGAGLLVDSCTAILITGNQFFSVGASRQTYGYYEFGTSNVDIRFTDNMSRATDHTTGGVFLGPGTDDGTYAVDAAATTGSLRTLGAGAQQAAAGNDARFGVEALPVSTGVAWTGVVSTSLANAARTINATLTGNVTLNLPTPPATVSYTVSLVLTQDGTGSRTLTLPQCVSAYGVDPVLSTTPGATDVLHLMWTGVQWIALMGAPAVS